jgi:two-component system response regulator VanR
MQKITNKKNYFDTIKKYLRYSDGGTRMSDKVLVVDDEHDIADLIEVYLQNENYTVFKFYSAKEALACIETTELDLAILDIMMPDINGFALCRKIREQYTFPVIMLTAKDEETDKIMGLTLGADDYITKPFRPLELIARVKAQLRRYKKYNLTKEKINTDPVLSYCGLEINIKTYECLLNEKPVSLTPTEFSILRILLENKGIVVSSEKLFHEIWKDEYYSKSNNTITVHIRHLREKIGDTSDEPKYIKTIWGVGYKI